MHTGKTLLLIGTLTAAPALGASDESQSDQKGSDGVVAPGAKIERVVGGFAFTEGPVAVGSNKILFTDIPNGHVLGYHIRQDELHGYMSDSGEANGLWWDTGRPLYGQNGRLVACEGGKRRMVRYKLEGNELKRAEVIVGKYKGKPLNSPNDLTIDAAGGIYFTDPRYGDRSSMKMDVEGVYYVTRKGEIAQVINRLEKPNGLILSQDETTLYVVDNGAENVWAFNVTGPGRLSNGRVFADMSEGPRAGGGDGMTLDEHGNVYAAGSQDVWVWNPDGKLIERIAVPEGPSNCTFGGPGRKTLYITARSSLYRIQMDVRGAR